MRHTHWKLAIVLALIAMLCATAHAAKDKKKAKGSPKAKVAQAAETEREVKQDQVPAAALKTLKKMARGAKITEFAEEMEHGSTFYEGSWKTKAGTNVDVLVTKAGDLVEIEEQVPTKKLPAAALKAAQKLAGKGAKVASEMKTMILYEIKFTKGDAHHEVLLTPDGRVVEQEIEKGKSDDDGDDEEEEEEEDGDDDDDDDDEDDEDSDDDEDEDEVSIKDVPKAVRATILKQARKGKVEEITKEKEDGKVIYEVEIEVGDKEYDLEIAANGKLLKKELEEEDDDDEDEDD